VLAALLLSLTVRASEPEPEADEYLDAKAAAKLLDCTTDTLYRNEKWKSLPFAKRGPLDHKIRFSKLGIRKYLQTKYARW
jgi:hypothetical protein